MKLRTAIQALILEQCEACSMGGDCESEISLEKDIVEPVISFIMGDEYPEEHTSEDGRMMDYGHTKSDSHEGRMTRAKLFRMGKMAQSFHDRLEDGDDLPEWVQDKVTTAEDRLRSAFEYVDYKLHRMKNDGKVCNESIVRNIARNYWRKTL